MLTSLKALVIFIAGILAAGIAILVTRCDETPATSVIRYVQDPWSFVQSAMASGEVPVRLLGSPFDAPAVALEDAVLRAMTDAVSWTARPQFTLDATGPAGEGIRIVVAFNPASPADPCRWPPKGGQPEADGRVTLLMGLCDGTDSLTRVDGRLPQGDGVDDPRFLRLLRQATHDLLAPPPAPQP